ncbi:hypothetical protein SSX86_028274 [Deinandra increscens subsp. villosa]|uniref:Uncharacterized protein n=1 Tax=Deinandra increscens subsp. villosa TaxID=3103831 RepID=A0AAP0GJG9_9ASTR
MVEKQLDFDAPLLSVRRLSSATSNPNRVSSNLGRKLKPTRQQSLPAARSEWEPEQEVTKPAAIPFIWEHIPGQAKDRKNTQNSQQFASTRNSIDEKSSQDSHTDAIDALSMSFSCDYSDEISDTESSRSFCSDFQTRDYLMNRFLPAAKSMTVETPQYVVKKQEKQEVLVQPPKYEKKVYSGELRPLLLEKYPVNANNRESEKERVVVDDSKKKLSKKGFGFGFGFFLPRICTKRSSSISSLIPGPKTKIHQSQSPVPYSSGPIPRLSRRTSYSGPLTPSLEKQAMDAVIKKRIETRSKEVHETQHKSNPLSRSGNSLPSSPNRGMSRSGRISPYRNESPRSPFHDGARFLGVPKDVNQNQIAQPRTCPSLNNQIAKPKTCPSLNVKSHFSPRLIYDSPPVVPEKTLYIDWNEKTANPTTDEVKTEANGDVDGSVIIPPLPKSPSESWLRRKMSIRSHFPKKMQDVPVEKGLKNGPKWETIVKTSNVHHDHVRYSEITINMTTTHSCTKNWQFTLKYIPYLQ